MPAAAASTSRTPTAGYFKCPNSLIENRALFTPAEFDLALIVLRHSGNAGIAVRVSDRHWTSWTGLTSRSKELAMKGLQKKGLVVNGRGESAKFQFRHDHWNEFVKHAEPNTKAHTERPVTAVKPRQGTKIHPACAENGCAMMARENQGQGELSLVPPAADAKPSSQTTGAAGDDSARKSGGGDQKLTRLVTVQVAKSISQVSDAAEQVWRLTFARLQELFPLIGVVFLARLVATVCAMFQGVTDEELLRAVNFAWQRTKATQKREGLFLFTVPEAVAALRRAPKPPPPSDISEGSGRLLTRVAIALRTRGGPLLEYAAQADHLAALSAHVKTSHDALGMSQMVQALQADIIQAARLEEQEERAVNECVEVGLERHGAHMNGTQRAQLRDHLRGREILTVLGIPSMTGGYA